MVPFCELFNHECIDVYYDFTYHPENPHKNEESEVRNKLFKQNQKQYPQPVQITQEDEENFTTSDGTYGSEDEESDSEFNFNIEDGQE